MEAPPPMGGWLDGWLGGLMGGSGQITQNQINLDLIEIFQFCLKIQHCGDSPTHGWVYGWLGGLMGGVRSNHSKSNKP